MPVWKWALLLLASLLLAFLMYGLCQVAFEAFEADWACSLVAILASGAMLALYALFVKWFEKHPARDIPFGRLVPDTLKGLGIGFGFFVLVVLVMFVFGLYKFDSFGTDRPAAIIASFFMFLMVAVAEEIIFRGILFRWIDEKWGFVATLIISSLLFGLLHIFQPGATLWSSFAIAVEAGLLGMQMFMHDSQFYGGDGIVKKGVENTIANIGRLARFGMEQTDREIIQLMMEN